MTALLSFIGSAFFKLAFERLVGFFERRQDNAHELKMLEIQAQIDERRFQHQMSLNRLQGEIRQEIGLIEAMRDAHAVDAMPSGVRWIDGWVKSIRPGVTTLLIVFYIIFRYQYGPHEFGEYDQGLLGVVLGYWFASRDLQKRSFGPDR